MPCQQERAILVDYRTNTPINGSTQIMGDDWMWLFRLRDTELTGAGLIFTAKSCIDDLDPGELQLSSSVATEIQIAAGSTASRLEAIIRVPAAKTEGIPVPFNEHSIDLWFDVQLIRSGTPTTAPKKETFFRREMARFRVILDVTKASAMPTVTP